MNLKMAKKLRKAAGYKPNAEEIEYKQRVKDGKKLFIYVDPNTAKGRYKMLKKVTRGK